MRINPGGRLNTEEIIGRDGEIARYWSILERQGLVISAERRIGKTHIVLKMQEECQSGYLPFYQDLEAVHSVADLIRSIYTLIEKSSAASPGVKARIAKWSGLFPKKIAGLELPTTDNAWQPLLSDAFDNLSRLADGRVLLMLWDEFPLMLHNLQRNEGHDSPMKLLDFLRALRLERSGRLRFLFTGSIGLHLVLRSLRMAGNANDPVNDMLSLTVPPLAPGDTRKLAGALLQETRAAPADIPELASRIASEVGGFPYYVHHVVDQIHQLPRQPGLQDVSSAVDSLIYDSHDPANFNYYVNRLSSYYSKDDRSLALVVLDTIAGQTAPTTISGLVNLCRHRVPSLAGERLRELLTVLAQDHYLEPRQCASGVAYDFRWPLVKRWWKETRQ